MTVGVQCSSVTESDVILRDGSVAHIRPVRSGDESALLGFYKGLTAESLALRFFSRAPNLAHEARLESQMVAGRFGLLATAGSDERVVGYAMYVELGDGRAEVAFTVADTYQGRGLGTVLLGQLAEAAASRGIHTFEAIVLPVNHRMVDVFRQSGFPIEMQRSQGELHVIFPTELSDEARARFERREQVAASSALHWFLGPRSVAVIGASRRRGTVGGEIFHNLLSCGLDGPVYPVNAKATVVQSVPAYRSVELAPGPVDLAVIAVPADQVIPAAEQCARKGVRSVLVISAGFAETGVRGVARQQALRSLCRRAGMRLIGPNSLGIVNTDPQSPLNAIFAPAEPIPGPIGFASQSGALGLAAISEASRRGLGISSFVSMGNKADISGNDLLNYWETDPRTRLIMLYLESFGNPRNFSRIARRVSRVKPIVAVKSGRSVSGARAAASHTGALVSGSDAVVDALFHQAGVIRTETLAQLFDAAALLVSQPVPSGRRVAIVTNVGGPAILCADACEAGGLELPQLSNETQEKLRAILPAEASVVNPIDMLAEATADQFRQALEIVGRDPDVDSVIALFIRPLSTGSDEVAAALLDAEQALGQGMPIVAVLMGCANAQELLTRGDRRIPAFDFPESAAQALARVARYGEWRATPPQSAVELTDVRRDEAAAIVAGALDRGGGWLEPDEVTALMACYGLSMPRQRIVTDPEAVFSATECLHRPVVLKAQVPGLTHKSDLGAVRLGLAGPKAVLSAARRMSTQLKSAGHEPTGYLIQEMVPPGAEMLVGVVHDPLFGPVVACGAGGVMVELMKDVSVRLAPLTPTDATEMIHDLRCFPLLTGFRGSTRKDVAALEDTVLRMGALAEDLPEIAELDCNPVIVHEHGAVVVDARVRVQTAEPRPPLGAR